MKNIILMCVIFFVCGFFVSLYANVDTWYGEWEESNFIDVGFGLCVQIWTCDCGTIMYSPDCKLTRSSNARTRGACSAAGGPADSCNQCLSGSPASNCQCTLTCPNALR